VNARDVMTAAVVSVGPDTPMREIAKVLCDNAISALPVLDAAGAPLGMVSEGDLIGRNETDREARRDWWLTLLAEGEELNADFLAGLRGPRHIARDVMRSPVVTIGEDTDIGDIARLLTSHRIKRVPVVRDGRVVGIVSRADLVRALASEEEAQPALHRDGGQFAEALAAIDQRFFNSRRPHHEQQPKTAPSVEPDDAKLTVADFRSLVAEHDHKQTEDRQAHDQAVAQQRRQHVADLTDHHIADAGWRSLMHSARQVAEQGGKEFMLLQFPSALCSDGSRAINSALPEWPATLRGESAELYLRWEHDLKSHGFNLGARVLDFPGGMPGDIGLFLMWGQ